VSVYAWWEIGAVAAWAIVVLIVACWPLPDDHRDCDDDHCCADCEATVQRIRKLLGDYLRKQSPVRETCELTNDEKARFEEITRGAGR
jgi:hypothetical protein